MSKSKKKSFIPKMIFSVILIVSLIAVTVTSSFSWFLYANSNMSYDIKVDVLDAYNLQLQGNVVGGSGIETNLNDNFRLKPVYGDGKNFYAPVFEERETTPGSGEYNIYNTGEYKPLTSDTELDDYIFFMDFTLLADNIVDLYLEYTDHARTFVTQGQNPQNRISPYGDFSRDNICGAVRVAILLDNEIKCIWIPNTDVELQESEDGCTLIQDNGAIEEKYVFAIPDKVPIHGESTTEDIEGEANEIVIETGGKAQGVIEKDGISYVWGDISTENCPMITRFYGSANLRVAMWIDGKDRECTNALIGGKVRLNLCFTTKSLGEEEENRS